MALIRIKRTSRDIRTGRRLVCYMIETWTLDGWENVDTHLNSVGMRRGFWVFQTQREAQKYCNLLKMTSRKHVIQLQTVNRIY